MRYFIGYVFRPILFEIVAESLVVNNCASFKALRGGKVTMEDKDEDAAAIDAVNRLAHSDDRVNNSLINLGDGTHIIIKK
jgi:predicted O-methyltransferase YrrM